MSIVSRTRVAVTTFVIIIIARFASFLVCTVTMSTTAVVITAIRKPQTLNTRNPEP